ncbi:cyclin-domain-containing protein [Microdochium bolleyi]|uniref:Cyclin-domain-containing protein n=1 Tax=Microdochium bolleyi TaxID=196109 RepID=A0A136JII1_9PEZI|nr:cyclin-domain-containing protein [Microdochium bolleyi]
MLTSSPVVSAPSPRSLHYVTTRSPLLSPSHRVVAPLPRRLSKQSLSHSPPSTSTTTTSMSAPPPPASPSPQHNARTTQYVAVDAATQYSPTEPFDPRVPLRAAEGPCPRRRSPSPKMTIDTAITSTTATEQPAAPAPGISAAPNTVVEPRPNGIDTATSTRRVDSEMSSVAVTEATDPAPAVPLATNPLSPSKRRKSIEEAVGTVAHPSTSVVVSSLPSSPKRSKPNQGPPKVLPLKYELCDVEDMVILIANMLSELIETNDAIAMKSGQLTRFHSRTAPGISVLDYLQRLAKHATLTPPLLLSMVYYIDRLCALYPDFTINTLTVHRFLITSATVAGKGLSDSFWNNSFYARVGGVKVQELKLLELEFLYRVDWKIVPNPEVLVAYFRGLVDRCDGYVLESSGDDVEGESSSDEIDDDEDDNDDLSDTSATGTSRGDLQEKDQT